LTKLTVRTAIIDGEIVSLDQKGRPSFEQLQARVNVSSPSFELQKRVPVYFYAFDLLYLEDKDLRKEPLIKRKQLLAEILRVNHLRYSDHVLADGNKFFDQIRKYNLEGMIAKDCSSEYEEKRSFKWLKVKTYQSQEAVVGGWLESEKGRKFASLALGVYEGDRLLFIGSVGTGFSQEEFESLFDILSALEIEKSPFVGRQPKGKIHWVLPKLVVQVKFVEWTKSGILRQPIFQGIRHDKNPKEVHHEIVVRPRNTS
jgi:bifunctional non-homologous end joining protein LigD